MNRQSVLFATLAAALLVSFGPTASAQNAFGRLTGRVTDPSGALTPGAAVSAVRIDTGTSTATRSNRDGNYTLANLTPGSYRVVCELAGFKRYERRVEVRIGDVVDLGIQLEVGESAQSVTVTDETPLLESSSSSVGQVTDSRRLLDLPIPSGSPTYLTLLAPGMITTKAVTAFWTPDNLGSNSNIGGVGTPTRSGATMIDGIPANTRYGQTSFFPPPEMLQEFKVETAPFDAAAGHFSGAQVNMVTKGGTNDWHASAIGNYTDQSLSALDFFRKRILYSAPVTQERTGSLVPPQAVSRVRGTVSGPVLIPKLYNGRNRTFWAYGIDVMDFQNSSTTFLTLPSDAQRRGDFSGLLGAGAQYQIYDPATIAPAPGGRFSRQPFPGNRIPAARLDPMALKFLELYPSAPPAGTVDGRNNFGTAVRNLLVYRSHMLRADHNFSDRHRVYGVLTLFMQDNDRNRDFPNTARGDFLARRGRGFAFDDVYVVNSTLVLNSRYGFNRFGAADGPLTLGTDLGGLGFPSALASQLDRALTALPAITIDGYAGIGFSGGSGSDAKTQNHFVSSQATWTRGKHTLRFGGEYRVYQDNTYTYGNISPAIAFGTTWTRGPLDSAAASPVGQGLASFLLGLPTGGNIDRNASSAETSLYYGLFFQDDWKVTRKLTVNLGLRYEADPPMTERFNRASRGFDFITANPIQADAQANYTRNPIPELPASAFRTPGGLLFAGTGGQPRGHWNTDRNNFSPRIGLAYSLTPKTVVRAGYGIFFEPLSAERLDSRQQGFSQRTTLVPSQDNGLTFRGTLRNPFPDGIREPAGAAQGLRTFLGQGLTVLLPGTYNGYMQRWSFNIQRELPSRIFMEAGYLGNRGTSLTMNRDFDAVPAQYLSRSPERDQAAIDFLSRNYPNPFNPIADFAGTGLQGANTTRGQLLRPFPQFTSMTAVTNEGYSWYHSAQLRFERRFSGGFTIQGSYAWSKFMEATSLLNDPDLRPHEAISALDRPHRVTMSGIWELPAGKGRRWMTRAPAILEQAAGGWSFNWIFQAQSGQPLDWGNVLFRGNIKDIPLSKDQRTVDRWFNTDAGFETSAARQLASNLRTFPLRLAGVRGPGFCTWDMSMIKRFRITEKLKLEFRAEAQDALNQAVFSNPSTAPANTLFGQINSVQGGAQRRVTLGGKVVW